MGNENVADEVARELVALATQAGLTVSTAESCTAGLIAAAIADVPGASVVLAGGAVTYTEEIKQRVLGVRPETLARYTAVSEPCAREMAAGAARVFGTDLAVSATGYAGPGGGTEQEPVGTVYIGICAAGSVRCERCQFSGDRAAVRAAARTHALEMLRDAARDLARHC